LGCRPATVPILFFRTIHFQPEVYTVLRKISLALVLASLAGVASAANTGSGDQCFQIAWFTFCSPQTPPAVKAPEIDPASAMAGLTMLAGGLAVLRGRRRKNSQE
jgi:LPXTG-motif cell wall-anchored protein